MAIVLFGAPGAGKGTQAVTLARRTGTVHVSTGDLFRSHVGDGTQLGRIAQRYLDAGQYVPDDVTNTMLRDHVRDVAPDGGFVLDGYPRTAAQIEFLDGLGTAALAVVALEVPADELIRRLHARADGRSDDDEATIRHRQELYLSETAPLLDEYRARGVLHEVDGTGDPGVVAGRIDAALSLLPARKR